VRVEFATATRVVFGPGTSRELPAIVRALGRRALLVTGRDAGRADAIAAALSDAGVWCARWAVAGEPTIDLTDEEPAAILLAAI
jgi:alcohol dehydrogenase class IV